VKNMSNEKTGNGELARLQAEAIALLRNNQPEKPPLPFLLNPLVEWFEERHVELMRQGAFPEARRAFNPVFIHLPADGCRLTELARRANMTKQAMAELVDELVGLGYLVRFPDPADGRAKIILRASKGLEAHETTMQAFSRIEQELADLVGRRALDELRDRLAAARQKIVSDGAG
jgi:DNA-binding MarR family transcriptional regulator